MYETATQKPVRIFTPPAGQEAEWRDFSANDYRLSPDGAMVAAAFLFPEKKESLSRVFDVATGTLLREVPGPDKAPNWPTWWNSSREGFAIGRGDGPPVLCDASGKEAGGFPAPSGYRFADSEMFSHPASRLVVVRTVEPTGIAVWRVGEGGAAPEQRWHLALPAWPSVVAWSPDGRQLAIADPKSHEILILDADTGKTTKHLPAGQAKILALVFPGDSILSLGHDERITWQSTSGPAFRLTTLAQARFLALSSDSRRIAYAPMKSTLGIAELVAPTSGKLWPGSGGHMRASCLGATPDGRTVVISTDAALEIWDTATGTLGERLAWPGGLKSDWPWFYVQPTGAAIVVSPGPHPAFFNPLWHFPLSAGRLGTPRQLTGTSPWDAVFGFSPDGKDWVVGGVSPTAKSAGEIDIAIWPDGDPARSRTVVRNTVASGLHICTPDSRYGITTTQRRADAHIWDLTTGKEVRTLGYPMPVTSIVSPDRRTLAIISPAESSLWDTATWTKRTTWPTPPGGDGFTAQFSPDGAYIAQLDRDGRVTIHAVADGAPLLTLALPPGFSPRECAWSSAEKIIVMDRVGAIYEWNLTTLAEAVRAVGLEW